MAAEEAAANGWAGTMAGATEDGVAMTGTFFKENEFFLFFSVKTLKSMSAHVPP